MHTKRIVFVTEELVRESTSRAKFRPGAEALSGPLNEKPALVQNGYLRRVRVFVTAALSHRNDSSEDTDGKANP